MSIKTHYDNLLVARDASSDVIRSAYKAITQKFNADRFPSADASRLMKTIHDSYAVLSNPVQRAEYDRWLLERESAEVGKGFIDNTDTPKNNSSHWLLYTLIGFALLLAIGWFVYSSSSLESKPEQQAPNEFSATELGKSSEEQYFRAIQNSQSTVSAPKVVAEEIPEHDQVGIDAFIGTWNGVNGNAGGQQTLDITAKSENSLIFRLDAKAGNSIGEVYGIAEFNNSYANFFNKEYNCSILFTIKSGAVQLNTSSCQEYHETGITFDGKYSKPVLVKAAPKATLEKPKSEPAKNIVNIVDVPQQTESMPSVPANVQKLRKFSATVQDSDGNVKTIDLLALDKEAARAIIRDFRGNPKVIKLKELKK